MREALIQGGRPYLTHPTHLPPSLPPPARRVMSQHSEVAPWPLLLPNLYFPAHVEKIGDAVCGKEALDKAYWFNSEVRV